jgi:hypothetical protein
MRSKSVSVIDVSCNLCFMQLQINGLRLSGGVASCPEMHGRERRSSVGKMR